MTRLCSYCKQPMGNSWHTETAGGRLEIFVHSKCSSAWLDKELRPIPNSRQIKENAGDKLL